MTGYKVLVYDNNHSGDESERIDYGVFATADEYREIQTDHR